MNAIAELAGLKRRLSGVETELEDLKLRVDLLAAELAKSEPASQPAPLVTALPPPLPLVVERTSPPPVVSSPPPPFPDAVVTPPEIPARPLRLVSEPVFNSPVAPPPPPPAPPPMAPEPEREDPPPVPRRNPLREWLEPLQLWPPEGEENTEVRLATWWTTRIGALLAVIGIVFLGIYVSHDSPPWIRLVEVLAASAGVLALGSRLERTLPKFGAVVFGAGLALSYFCAFAAHAVPAMKVIENPVAAMGLEVAVVAAILGVAWRRNSQLVASMAVTLGYVTAFVGLQDQRFGFGPWVILLLGIAAVVLRLARQWQAPSALAMLATWAFLGVATFVRRNGVELHLGLLWIWCALHLILFTARDWIHALRGGVLGTFDRALQVTNSSLAIAVALLAAVRAGGDAPQHVFFFGGAAMLLLAWAWRAVKVEALGPVLVCKGAGLIALGVIDAFAGQARCLVLLAQAFVMLVSARQSHQRWLRIATAIVGAVAVGFYIEALRAGGAEFATGATGLEIAFLAGAIAFVASLQRWMEFGRLATAVGSAIVGVLAVVTTTRWALHGWTPAAEVGLAVVLAGIALALRGAWPAAVAGAIVLTASHVEMWIFNMPAHGRVALWWSELAVLAGGFIAGFATRAIASEDVRLRVRAVLMAAVASTLVAVGFKGLAPAAALALAYAVALAFVAVAPRGRGWPFAVFAMPLIVFAWGLLLAQDAPITGSWLWGAVAAGWAIPLWLTVSSARLEGIEPPEWRRWVPAVHTWLAVAVTLLALWKNLHGEMRVLGLVVAALAGGVTTWRPRLFAALEASWVFWVGVILQSALGKGSDALWLAAPAAWIAAITLGCWGGLEPLRLARPGWRTHAGSVQSWLATALTLLAVEHTWRGEMLVAALACSALAIAALLWRPGLRAALETSWAFWLVALLKADDAAVREVYWLVAPLSWLPAIMFARIELPAAAPGRWSPWRHWRVGIQVTLATMFTLVAVNKNLAGSAQLAGLAAAALAILGIAWLARVRPALESSWAVWGVIIVTAARAEPSSMAWLVALLAWGPALALARGASFRFLGETPPSWRAHADSIQVVSASVLGVAVAVAHGGMIELLALGVLVAIAVGTWRWGNLRAARPASAAIAALAWGEALRFALTGRVMGWSFALAAAIGVAAIVVVLPLCIERDLDRPTRTRLRWPAAGAGLALAVAVFVVQRGDVAPFATIGCGVAAVATFLVGLSARSRPHRLCGLAGLALCIPRAFIVDLHSMLHRIAAFVALGVVLLAVGFSYDRFRHFIDDDKKI